jgi:hypothetical protein
MQHFFGNKDSRNEERKIREQILQLRCILYTALVNERALKQSDIHTQRRIKQGLFDSKDFRTNFGGLNFPYVGTGFVGCILEVFFCKK